MLTIRQKEHLKKLLQNEDSFATSLLAICLDLYGTKIFEWEPESLWLELAEDTGVVLPRVNKDKIQALITALTTDLFYTSVEAFNHICNVLSGSEASFDYWDVLTPEEILWGIYEVSLNDSDEENKLLKFSDEIKIYIGEVLKDSGIVDPPDVLKIGQILNPYEGLDQFSDDPELFNAIFDKQEKEKRDLIIYLINRLYDLLKELNSLPLNDKNSETWNSFLNELVSKIKKLSQSININIG